MYEKSLPFAVLGELWVNLAEGAATRFAASNSSGIASQ